MTTTRNNKNIWLRRRLAGGAIPAALVFSAVAALGCRHRSTTGMEVIPTRDQGPVRVAVAVVQARPLPQTLRLTGTLMPDQQSEVTPIVAGRVMEVMVERGSVVRAGQPLMRLRDVDYRSALTLANASLAQARARLGLAEMPGGRFDPQEAPEVRAARANMELAEDSLRRVQQLSQSGSSSDQDLRRAQSAASAARDQYQSALNNIRSAYIGLQSARTSMDQARRNVADSIVRAPFDGEVSERRANVGEFVSSQRAVVTLVRTNPLRLELQIPQERIPYVRRGLDVHIRVDAFPNRPFAGTVQYISAAVRQDTRALIAEAVVPNDDGALRPGVFVNVQVDLGQPVAAVAVPARAIVSESGTQRLYVISEGRAQERVLQVGERGAQEWLIVRGVAAGEQVALDHLDTLSDGARVVTGP